MKYSKQRELVHTIVQNSVDHPTAEKIYEEAKKEMPNISLGTVYRNLKVLVEKELILQVKGLDEKDRFDKTLYDHGHMLCDICGRIHDICDDSIKQFKDKVYIETGFEVKDYIVSMNGVCHSCKKEERKLIKYGIKRN